MKTRVKFSKQILSIVLCLAMLMSYVPMTAYAAEPIILSGNTFTTDPGEGFTFWAKYYCGKCNTNLYINNPGAENHSLEITSFNYTISQGKISYSYGYKVNGCEGEATGTFSEKTYTFDCSSDQYKYYTGQSITPTGLSTSQSVSVRFRRDSSAHQGNATCATADNCVLCGTSYKDASNHEKTNEFTYSVNSDPAKHDVKYACCGATKETVAHSLQYSHNGNTITETCANDCGHSATATLAIENDSYAYTGTAITPATITYTDNWQGEKPTEISYSNNINASTEGNSATAKITVNGYELSDTFQITQAIITDENIVLNPESGTYTGTAYEPKISVVWNDATLVEDTHYKVSWDKTGYETPDTYTARVVGIGNFDGYVDKTFTINVADLSDVEVKPTATLTYDGTAQTPTVSASAVAVNKQPVTFTYNLTQYGLYSDLPQFTNARSYTVYYRASAPNHADAYGQFTVTVDKADNTWTTIPSINGWTYGETANAPTYEAKFGDVKVTYTGKANDDSDYNSETAPTKAGTYTATFTVEASDNYSGLSASVDFTIARAPVTHTGTDKTATYTPDMVIDLREMFDVDPNAGEASYYITDLTGSGSFTDAPYLYRIDTAGTFTVLFSTKITATHRAGIARAVLTINPADPAIGTVSANVVENTLETSAIVLTRENTNIPGTLTVDAEQTLALGENEIKYTFTPVDNDNYKTVTGTVNVIVVDTQAPTGKVYFDERSGWESFLNTITFGLFYKDEVTVKVDATDKLSGVAKIEYYAADHAMTLDEVKAITAWMPYEDGVGVTVEDTKQFVYFVRITDDAGNVTYLSTDGAEYDTTAPAISGIENGKTYYTTQKVTVTDKNIESITLNGETASESITLEGNKEATYTIVATDKAGNVTTYTVTMKPIADVDTTIDGITGDDVTSEDKETVQDVIDEIDELLKDEDLTDDEKAALEEVKDSAEKLIDKIEEADAADETENIKKVEDVTAENVTPEDKTDLENAKSDLEKALEDNGDNYTDDEKKVIEDELGRIEDALEIIENVENVEELIDKLPDTITKDDEAAIKAADDAYNALTDYEKSLVDDDAKKALDDAKAALAELNKPADSTSPNTGDNSNLWLWFALLFVSGTGIFAITVYDRKRKVASK